MTTATHYHNSETVPTGGDYSKAGGREESAQSVEWL